MKRVFVEMPPFRRRVDEAGFDALAHIQNEMLPRLDHGDLMPGSGGLRKLRVSDPMRGKGKRGGFRIVYLDLPRISRTYLIALYDKDEKIDISEDEKKALRLLSKRIKEELRYEED